MRRYVEIVQAASSVKRGTSVICLFVAITADLRGSRGQPAHPRGMQSLDGLLDGDADSAAAVVATYCHCELLDLCCVRWRRGTQEGRNLRTSKLVRDVLEKIRGSNECADRLLVAHETTPNASLRLLLILGYCRQLRVLCQGRYLRRRRSPLGLALGLHVSSLFASYLEHSQENRLFRPFSLPLDLLPLRTFIFSLGCMVLGQDDGSIVLPL